MLGLGLFTDTPSPDYLTFEEGYATIIEAAMDDDRDLWKGGGVNYYIGIACAAVGDDFRSVFEKTWRYNLLSTVDQDDTITDDMIQKARRTAYTNCVRIFRGNPTHSLKIDDMPTQLIYNKDLSYIAGKVKAMTFIRRAYRDNNPQELDIAMYGKFDPTNPLHYQVATDAFRRAGFVMTAM